MTFVVYTSAALADLMGIGSYIATNSPHNADALVRKLRDKAAKIARRPRMCRSRDDLGPGLRSAPLGNYLIVFRIVENGIEVIRVVHGARHLPALFGR